MTFHPMPVAGAYVIAPEPHVDRRGFFARTWCAREFAALGLRTRFVQGSISFSEKKGTLRGMHYQIAPDAEVKLVRCTMGAVYDVIIDLRADSPTFMRHAAVVLTAENRKTVYVPEGFAHGFQTLVDATEVAYEMTAFHAPQSARGVRWNDPAFAIPWPPDERVIAERDQSYPDFIVPLTYAHETRG